MSQYSSTSKPKAAFAYDFDWYVSFTTSANDYWTWTDSGPQWPSSTWETNPTDEYTAFNGWVKGKVSTSSRAYLTDGRVCWSGGPWDEEYVS